MSDEIKELREELAKLRERVAVLESRSAIVSTNMPRLEPPWHVTAGQPMWVNPAPNAAPCGPISPIIECQVDRNGRPVAATVNRERTAL